ncbi:SelT/SelW/SelH family protein [Microvirga tunisiensis]|uniref:SelT/SelW/SelH family protein n=1 Tax=Microvirga tunisiensis TaxID=2108360 RepID=A0A5N7MT83_9HYPH|nr:SelT/SelW/SelH family protein [Microvirga tunisiensis]MPR30173.1 SelT/SelW/SelH family protein [Microvirga tunisiensis]
MSCSTQCRWLLRAAWLAQELLSSIGTDLGKVALVPGTGGIVKFTYEDEIIWDRKCGGGFPEAKLLKQRVHALLDSERSLGRLYREPAPRAPMMLHDQARSPPEIERSCMCTNNRRQPRPMRSRKT